MEYILIPIVAAGASLLTFFSGFGLGTLLLPAFAVFYPPVIAVALTAVVHLLNNLFKVSLVGKHTNWKVALTFGVPAIGGALLGAWLLNQLSHAAVLTNYQLGNQTHEITWVKLVVAGLMIVFALFEVVPSLKNLELSSNLLIPGGMLSGFFGGLSGHQGALRSAFLVRLKLPKETFIATGVMIAVFIDLTRISFYTTGIPKEVFTTNWLILSLSIFSAFIGAYFGSKLLKKVTLGFLQTMVAVLLFLLAGALASGLI